MVLPRGKILGGCNSINSMACFRHLKDFDDRPDGGHLAKAAIPVDCLQQLAWVITTGSWAACAVIFNRLTFPASARIARLSHPHGAPRRRAR
jgi:choline dehydrogenase-like flavoprotein